MIVFSKIIYRITMVILQNFIRTKNTVFERSADLNSVGSDEVVLPGIIHFQSLRVIIWELQAFASDK